MTDYVDRETQELRFVIDGLAFDRVYMNKDKETIEDKVFRLINNYHTRPSLRQYFIKYYHKRVDYYKEMQD